MTMTNAWRFAVNVFIVLNVDDECGGGVAADDEGCIDDIDCGGYDDDTGIAFFILMTLMLMLMLL